MIINITDKQKKIFSFILLTVAFIAATLATRKVFYDPDSFWHIKTGLWILDNKQIPHDANSSWYAAEHHLTWLNHEWLFELLLGFIYRIGNLNLVMWFVSVIGGVLFLLLSYFNYIRNKHLNLSIIIGAISIYGLQPYLQARPQILSFCLLTIVCILLEKKKWYWVLPIMVLEANLHGGFWPLFIIVITYYSYKEKPLLILWSILAVAINPHVFGLYTYTFKNQSSSVGATYIIESLKTQMADQENKIVLLSYMILIAATHNIKVKWQEACLVFAVGTLTFMAQRHVIFAYLLILPTLSPYLLIKINSILDWLGNIMNSKSYKNFIYYLVVEGMIIILLIGGIGNLTITPDRLIPENLYPSEKAIQFIKDHNVTRIFNDLGNGGYLLFHDVPTLIDGRGDPFSDKFNDTTILQDYCAVLTMETDYIKFLKDNKIKYLLLPNNSKLAIALNVNPRFDEPYTEKYYTLYYFKE